MTDEPKGKQRRQVRPVCVALTAENLRELDRQAERCRMSRSRFVRFMILRAARKVGDEFGVR